MTDGKFVSQAPDAARIDVRSCSTWLKVSRDGVIEFWDKAEMNRRADAGDMYAKAFAAVADTVRREALEEAARLCDPEPDLRYSPNTASARNRLAKAIRALMETPQGVSTQPAPSEPHGDAIDTSAERVEKRGENRHISDALPDLLPLPDLQGGVYLHPKLGELYDTLQVHQRMVSYAMDYARAALAQSADAKDAAIPDDVLAFLRKLKDQTPEKPDYWSSCGQCGYNSNDADDLLEKYDAAQQGKEGENV